MPDARIAFFVLGLAMTAPALGLPAKNPGFERWDARGRPEGWGVAALDHYTVSADCIDPREGTCALRIEAKADVPAGMFLPLSQSMGAGGAAGHRLELSGWIRTAAVEGGWAGLWMRADVEGKTMALENMSKEGPRGTTPWRRFTIAIDVPSNATLVSFGVLLSGRGSAWFDGLALAVDASVKVGRALKTEVIFPPRPVPSSEHASDAALRFPASEMPRVRADRVLEARAAARPVRSLFSEDFSDLQFLKPLLAGKRVVMLGESGHGVAEFNWMKVRLVKFLHRELGFDVVAFESSMSACDLADARIGQAAPVDVMRDSLFGVWHSTETLGLFEYLDRERAAGRRISLAGFDVQNSGRTRADIAARLVKQVARVDAALAERIRRYEGNLSVAYAAGNARDMKAAYAEAARRVQDEREALRKLEARPVEVDLAIRELASRVRYVDALVHGMGDEGLRARDQGMSENLEFLLDTLHPGRKVVVWAHNSHIARHEEGQASPRMMGAWFAQRRAADAYVVGLYMGWGIATRNDRFRYEIRRPEPDTLEAVLASAGWRQAFFDLSGALGSSSWAQETLTGRTWGTQDYRLTPAKAYDALIYIDAVTPPEYL